MMNTYKRSLIVIHLFYFLLLFTLYEILTSFLTSTKTPQELVEILSWIPIDYFLLFKKSIAVVGLTSLVTCSFYPWFRTLRVTSFFTVLFAIAIQSSYGKVIHGHYGSLFAALALIALPVFKRSDREERTIQTLFIAQFSSILCYALAGLWKLRFIPTIISEHGLDALVQSLGNTIALEHLTYSLPVSEVTMFFLNHDYLTGILFFILIILQAFSPLLVFLKRWHLLFGILLVSFHALSEVILKIPFRPQMYLMIVFFIFSPFTKLPDLKIFRK